MTEAFVALLYQLVRDEVPFGVVERYVKDLEEAHRNGDGPLTVEYSEAYVSTWAREIVDRLAALGRPVTKGDQS